MDKIWNFIKLYGKFLNIRDQIKKNVKYYGINCIFPIIF
jgi:hypothetical protein